jgi:hypothetical protein
VATETEVRELLHQRGWRTAFTAADRVNAWAALVSVLERGCGDEMPIHVDVVTLRPTAALLSANTASKVRENARLAADTYGRRWGSTRKVRERARPLVGVQRIGEVTIGRVVVQPGETVAVTA